MTKAKKGKKKRQTKNMNIWAILSSFLSIYFFAMYSFTPCAGADGGDLIVADIQGIRLYGSVGNVSAYSIGTYTCNLGDERVSCVSYTNQHPVIAQNMYRLKDGRFEQIGQSWVVHYFYAVSWSLCTPCYDPTDGSEFGVGCSDPMSATLNGAQANMSRRSDVNAHTGYFPYPWTTPNPVDLLDKRIQVAHDNLDPELNVGALYFVEGHYIVPDDAIAGTALNNVSWRQITITESEPNIYNAAVTGITQRENPAIFAWQLYHPEVEIQIIDVPGEGRFWMGTKVTEMGNNTWRYDYAIHNLNSDRSASSFTVPLPPGVNVTNIGFHDVDYHSGEIYDNTDWTAAADTNALSWSSSQTYAENPGTNALRWGTMYNFWFEANSGPIADEVSIELFKPGVPSNLLVNTMVPGPGQPNINMPCIPLLLLED